MFYLNVITDPRIAHFFEDMDMEREIMKQQAILRMAFGGLMGYTVKDLRESHAGLLKKELSDDHFDAFVEDFLMTLEKYETPPEEMEEAIVVGSKNRTVTLLRSQNYFC